jgi:5-methylcytosine-specific restriction protein A
MSSYVPLKPLKPCKFSGCSEVTRDGRYCDFHKTVVSRQYDREHRNPKHYDHRWRKIRNLYISKNPLCESCLERGLHVPADEVHHIRSLDDGGTHSDENLRSLCKSCHTKTRYE